jgi:hypothetical protein
MQEFVQPIQIGIPSQNRSLSVVADLLRANSDRRASQKMLEAAQIPLAMEADG